MARPDVHGSILSPAARHGGLLRAQSETFDVIVIGGGVTGTGVALDAASRGLSTLLLERRDFAAGTSSRSSKLIHGGLRYLEQRDFALVREALRERRVLLEDVAPHLVRAAPFLLPLRKRYERAYIGAGVLLYDVLAGRHAAVPRHRHLSHRACMELAPSLDPRALVGGIVYSDAQIDDARHTVVVARTAASYGAVCLAGIAVERVIVEGGKAVGVEVTDREDDVGGSFIVRGRSIVNATGVWTTAIETSAGVRDPLRVRASKGIHIVVPRARIDSTTAMILRTDKSVLFLIPWGDRWIIGTTDTDWSHDLDHPVATKTDIDYVLRWANTVLSADLRADDIIGVYSGLRPLLSGGAASTAKLSREHTINRGMPGLISVAGGKYTTYRIMARDAVDALADDLGSLPTSVTESIPLLGAEGHTNALARLRSHAGAASLPSGALEHLVARYGSTAEEVLDVIVEDPSLAHAIPEAGIDADRRTLGDATAIPNVSTFDGARQGFGNGARYLLAEAVHAVRFEGAQHLDDVLTRRTRLSIESTDRGLAASPAVAEVVGSALGWSSEQIRAESDRYGARVLAEREAEQAPDDATANDRRVVVRDPRLLAS